MSQPPRIVVVGSINFDLVARVPKLPRPGETVLGHEFQQVPGGKGANQAVAAALLGANVTLIGRVGDDVFGGQLIAALAKRGVRTESVQTTPGATSGLALIGVEDSGQNAITVVGGANQRLSPDDVRLNEATIAAADALLVQLEVPLETVGAAVEAARRSGVFAVLDPAPAASLPNALLAVDLISPNQTEAEVLTGLVVRSASDAARAAAALHQQGVRQVVVKLGEQGALASEAGGAAVHVPAPAVAVVDTIAAGDAFTAALAIALIEGQPLDKATRFACAAGSLATTREGAQDAMPTREDVDRLIASGD